MSCKFIIPDETVMEDDIGGNRRQKCGEISLSNNYEVFFTCTFCEIELRSIRKFLKHISNQHIVLNTEKLQDIEVVPDGSESIKRESACDEYVSEENVEVLEDMETEIKDAHCDEQENEQLNHWENSLEDSKINVNFFKDEPQADTISEDCEILKEEVHVLTTADECRKEMKFLDDCFEEVSEETEAETEDIENDEIGIRMGVFPQGRISSQKQLPPVPNTIKNQCNICLKVLRNEAILKTHLQRHSEVKARPYVCQYCESSFANKSNLNVHIKRHLGIKPYHCEACDKWFTSSTELKLHSYTHSGAKRFKCSVCERDFSRRDHLNAHCRRHYEQKRYECETCGNKFYDRRQLRDHQTTHSAERPFTCETCGLTFKREKALVEHKKLHSGVKNYTCKICTKSFAQYPGLYSHMKSHKTVKQ